MKIRVNCITYGYKNDAYLLQKFWERKKKQSSSTRVNILEH